MSFCTDFGPSLICKNIFSLFVGGAKLREGGTPQPTNTVLQYLMEKKKWVTMAPMNVARMKHSLCVLDGLIYAIGGIGEGNQ